ncbi:hypothetical protein KTS45_18310 [Halomicroarcula limicola]|uniref:SPW repeat-containing integral membrane domain-containing protein n=1 Tax=Haloarcula limicola TaxID=1429915 RepID=A0A8J7YE02_9EURY|nr:hypothetical protein [Halomicroarcula limicola]MBV0926164.1 hypothetical protein [Halomicroarcula limicola]
MNTASLIKWLSAVVVAVGCWLIVGPPFLYEAPFADFWSDLIVGVVLVGLAAYTYARRDQSASQWSAAAIAVFGAWLVVAAVLWETSAVLHWNDVAAGVGVALAGGISAYGSHAEYASNDDSDDSNDDSSDDSSDSGGSSDDSDSDNSDSSDDSSDSGDSSDDSDSDNSDSDDSDSNGDSDDSDSDDGGSDDNASNDSDSDDGGSDDSDDSDSNGDSADDSDDGEQSGN